MAEFYLISIMAFMFMGQSESVWFGLGFGLIGIIALLST